MSTKIVEKLEGMRAIVAEGFGGYQNLKAADIPKPAVLDGRVLVRVTVAGVTPLDYTILSGNYPMAKAPLVLGNEGAGVVEEGRDDQFPDGSRVMFTGPYGVSENGASISGIKGQAGLGIYSATKAALRNLVRTWVLDLKGRGIRVNAISPGTTVTPGLDGLVGQGVDPKGFYEYLGGLVPLGRNAQPVEIANVVAFLASDQASYVNAADF